MQWRTPVFADARRWGTIGAGPARAQVDGVRSIAFAGALGNVSSAVCPIRRFGFLRDSDFSYHI
jgi:hypothetical protein